MQTTIVVPDIFFSICIPSFHSETRIERAVRSIIESGYRAYEILICDQGDTDSTFLLSKYSSIRILHLGLPSTYNARCELIKAATGDYILWLDDDDTFSSDALEILSDVIKRTGCLDIYMFGKAQRGLVPTKAKQDPDINYLDKRSFLRECLLTGNGHYNDVVSKCFKNIDNFSYEPKALFNNEDGYLLLELLEFYNTFATIDCVLYWPSDREGSVSKGLSLRKIANMCQYCSFLFRSDGKDYSHVYVLKTINEAHNYLHMAYLENGLNAKTWGAFTANQYVRSLIRLLRAHPISLIARIKSKYAMLLVIERRWAYRFVFRWITRGGK